MNPPRLKAFGFKLKPIDTRRLKLPDKVVDGYYNSPEHKAWRLAVMTRAGWRCEKIIDGRRCERRSPAHRMFADHIVERRDDPSKSLDVDNGMCLCGSHHTEKTHAEAVKRGTREY
jgi:hypothetical protein